MIREIHFGKHSFGTKSFFNCNDFHGIFIDPVALYASASLHRDDSTLFSTLLARRRAHHRE